MESLESEWMSLRRCLDSSIVPFGFESGSTTIPSDQIITQGLDRAHELEVLAQLKSLSRSGK